MLLSGEAEMVAHRLRDVLDRMKRNPEVMGRCKWHPEQVAFYLIVYLIQNPIPSAAARNY
jgi:hypothetical protein